MPGASAQIGMETTSGGPLANNVNALWQIALNYSVPAVFDQVRSPRQGA
jgi:hypothetical protein